MCRIITMGNRLNFLIVELNNAYRFELINRINQPMIALLKYVLPVKVCCDVYYINIGKLSVATRNCWVDILSLFAHLPGPECTILYLLTFVNQIER